MNDIAAFFSSIADIFILLCLIELALSFLRALGNDSAHYRIIRFSDFFAIAILFVIAVVALAEGEDWVTKSQTHVRLSWTIVGKLYSAYHIVYWITSLAVAFLSIFVLYSSIQKKHMRSVSKAS
jgi:uncharacterized membrane protein